MALCGIFLLLKAFLTQRRLQSFVTRMDCLPFLEPEMCQEERLGTVTSLCASGLKRRGKQLTESNSNLGRNEGDRHERKVETPGDARFSSLTLWVRVIICLRSSYYDNILDRSHLQKGGSLVGLTV